MTTQKTLPDTRPYPTDPVKNDLLLYAKQIAHSSGATQKLAQENLLAQVNQQFTQRHTLGLSVAMSMAPDVESYCVLMDSTASALDAKTDDEIQWFALPVILVSGSKQAHTLTSETPINAINQVLGNYPHLRILTQATWLPNLIRADDFSHIKPESWYAAKRDSQAAAEFAAKLPQHTLTLPKDQSVHVLYAVGYGERSIQAALGQNLREAALPLMQAWQTHLVQTGLTLFTNPLNPNNPIQALADARFMRLRMALDVFAANAIRAVRLQSPRVGVVMAAQQGGKLLFGFDAAESVYSLQNQIFTWELSPRDNIASIQQNFLDLMTDCQVENLYLLHDALPENAALPNYADAHKLAGHNPLFGNG
ncbi:conjugal transfer protein [Neisseriaceae bacterium B1]